MKTKKKGLHQKRNAFLPPNSSGDLRSDAHQSQIIGGNADVDHTQIIGGDTVKLLGGYNPSGFRHPCTQSLIGFLLALDIFNICLFAEILIH